MTSDNSESQIGLLNLKSIKIKFSASRNLRFNLRFEIWDFTIRQSTYYVLGVNCGILKSELAYC